LRYECIVQPQSKTLLSVYETILSLILFFVNKRRCVGKGIFRKFLSMLARSI